MAITLDGTTGIITPTVASTGALSGTTATFTTVGIGTATPAVSLDIGGQPTPSLRLLSTTNAVDFRIQVTGAAATSTLRNNSNHPMAIFTNNLERMRITADGDVGIGTITPTARLEVVTSSGTATTKIWSATNTTPIADLELQRGTNATWGADVYGDYRLRNDAGSLIFQYGENSITTERMRISDTGAITQLNATSGRGDITGTQIFRLAADGTAIGPTIADYYGATSSISLEAASMYEITFHTFFLKTTAGTLVFTLTGSSAPTSVVANYIGTPITGTGGAGVVGTITSAATAATAFAATGSLTTAVNHAYEIKARVLTNLATDFRLRVTNSAGTVTPRAGSYYTVRKISASTGTFV